MAISRIDHLNSGNSGDEINLLRLDGSVDHYYIRRERDRAVQPDLFKGLHCLKNGDHNKCACYMLASALKLETCTLR